VKSKVKLTQAAELIASGDDILVVDAIAIFGQTVWACTVTGFRLGELYHVIKFIRRIQRREMNDVIKIWACIREHWRSTLLKMTTMHFVAPATPTSTATVFTDASLAGWGVVILDYLRRPIRIFAGKWSRIERNESINMLELRTLRIGIRILASLKESTSEVISLNAFIDNTSAQAWATRRRAPRWATNELALQIDDELVNGNIQLSSLDYVETARNIADGPSRIFVPK
jgi:hypothetical protein